MASDVVKFGDWINGGWKLFTLQWQTWVLASLIHVLPFLIPAAFLIIGIYAPLLMRREPHPEVLIPLIFIMPVMILFSVLVSGGMHRMAQKQLRGQTISVKDIFSCGDCYGRLLIAALLIGLATMCGAMLCIVPGYIVGALLFFTIPLIVDRDLSATEAMTRSYDLVKRDWPMFTLFVFVAMLIAQAGVYFCYVGLLASYPLLFTITAVAYKDCFGLEGAQAGIVDPDVNLSPSLYSPPTPPNDVTNPYISACPSCNAYMPTSATFCPKCGLKR